MPAPPVPDWCDARASASPSHPQIVVKEDGKTVKEVDGYGHEKPGKLVVKEDGKVYRYHGYGNRAEAGYLQIKGDKIYKDDGYGSKTRVGKVKKEKK